MHLKEVTPRLNYLKYSAGALSSTSPSTAAYLMSVHHGIFLDEHKQPNQRLHDSFCSACGSPRNRAWTKTASIKKKSQKRATAAFADGATVYKCMRCRRRTVTPSRIASKTVPIPATVPVVQSHPAATTTTTHLPDQLPASKAADNANSKKRAKARKQGGLQALMAAKQSRTEPSQSLDLFDFLQQ
ncbi:hypothetical protein BJX70DRAFT_114381 [Aspergillus crustosus]